MRRLLIAFAVCHPTVALAATDSRSIPTAQERVGNPNEREELALIRAALERWETTLNGPDGAALVNASWKGMWNYLDVWATIDLDRSVEIEKARRVLRSQGVILGRLAGAERWDDAESYMDANPEYFFNDRTPRFWARAATYGAEIGDLSLVERAGRRIKAYVAARIAEPDAPTYLGDTVALAQFYVAASRVHLLRKESELRNLPNLTFWDEQNKELTTAFTELWRAAKYVPPRLASITVFRFTRSRLSSTRLQHYAALESWMRGFGYAVHKQRNQNFVYHLIKSYESDSKVSVEWPSEVALPNLSEPIASAWLIRQMLLERPDVALTFVWLAPGSTADRARQVAILARHLPDDQVQRAEQWSEAAFKALLNQTGDAATVQAFCELSVTFSELGESERATECLDRAVAAWPEFDDSQWSAQNTCHATLLHALSGVDSSYAEFSNALDCLGEIKYGRQLLVQYPLSVDGLPRFADLSDVIPESMRRAPTNIVQRPSNYSRLVDERQWREALLEAARLARGNSSWQRQYAEIGAKSVRDVGLAATLEWCATIPDLEMRMRAEVGAMQEVVKHRRRLIPRIDARRPSFVAPTIAWPSGC